jgi:hypothetical protein
MSFPFAAAYVSFSIIQELTDHVNRERGFNLSVVVELSSCITVVQGCVQGSEGQLQSNCHSPFLGEYAKLGNSTISFVMSVRLSVLMEQLGSH